MKNRETYERCILRSANQSLPGEKVGFGNRAWQWGISFWTMDRGSDDENALFAFDLMLTRCKHPVRWTCVWRWTRRVSSMNGEKWAQNPGSLPPAVSCLYSVISLRRAVWLDEDVLEDNMIWFRELSCARMLSANKFNHNPTAHIRLTLEFWIK